MIFVLQGPKNPHNKQRMSPLPEHLIALKKQMEQQNVALLGQEGKEKHVQVAGGRESSNSSTPARSRSSWSPSVKRFRTQEFPFEADFDHNGLLYFLGSQGKDGCRSSSWTNPAVLGVVTVSMAPQPSFYLASFRYLSRKCGTKLCPALLPPRPCICVHQLQVS